MSTAFVPYLLFLLILVSVNGIFADFKDFLDFDSVLAPLADDGFCYGQTSASSPASSSQIVVVSTQEGHCDLVQLSSSAYLPPPSSPSFPRSRPPCSNPCCNGTVEAIKGSLEVFELQKVESLQHQLLRRLWRPLGGLHGSFVHPSKPAGERTDTFAKAAITAKDIYRLVPRSAMEWRFMGRWIPLESGIAEDERYFSSATSSPQAQQEVQETQGFQGRWQRQAEYEGQTAIGAAAMVIDSFNGSPNPSSPVCGSVQGRGKAPGDCGGYEEEGQPRPGAPNAGSGGGATAESERHVQTDECSEHKHGDAKTALLEARQARANLHAVWKQYLDTAVQTWKGFLEDFDKEDKKLEDQITAAETGLSTAQENLDEAKQRATAQELREQVEEVIDDADMLDKTTRSGPAIREGLSEMLEGLQKLQAQTEEVAVDKAEDRKRQRLEDGSGKPSSVPPAMQPFGKADR